MVRVAVIVTLALTAAAALCGGEASEEEKWLAEADRMYRAGDAGMAIYDYRLYLERFPIDSCRSKGTWHS